MTTPPRDAARPSLPRGVVTGLGALDTADPWLAARIAIQEAHDFPHIPELPLRGPWAEPLGRVGALLIDLPVELEVGRWRMTSGEGRDLRRARSLLEEDLDAVEEQWSGFSGPAKLQVLGPLSTAATLELRGGEAVVADHGALDDLVASLVEGLAAHLDALSHRVPGAAWAVQIDEPHAADVVRGTVGRPSGWGSLAPVPSAHARELLARIVGAAHRAGAGVALHCCDPEPDWGLLTGSGAEALSIPLPGLPLPASGARPGEWESRLDRWWNDGGDIWGASSRPDEAADLDRARSLASVVGADAEQLSRRLVLTPQCAWAPGRLPAGGDGPAPVGPRAYAAVRALARRLAEG